MKPTRVRLLAAIAAVALVFGWLLTSVVDQVLGRLLQVPWAAAGAMALVAVAMLIWGILARPRLQRSKGRPPLDPIVAARTAALSLAASRTGAGVMGFYVGIALGMAPSLHTPAGRQYALAAAAAALASLCVVLVALWIESMCRIKGGGDDDEAAGPAQRRPSTGHATNQATRGSK